MGFMSEISKMISELVDGKSYSINEAARIFQIILLGGATPAQIAAIVSVMAARGETKNELLGAVKVLRSKVKKIKIDDNLRSQVIDVCGSGGDKKHTLNISSTVAIVLSACGVKVAKHGNRAISSASGSSDVLQELGIKLDVSEGTIIKSLEEANFCFLLAPKFHQSMKHVMPVRRELGIRTLFNVLGPLINPIFPKRQLIGMFSDKWLRPVAEILTELGVEKAWVVHGQDGMDEISISAKTKIVAVDNGKIEEFELNPEDYGIKLLTPDEERLILGEDAIHNANAMKTLFAGGVYHADVVTNLPESKLRNAYKEIVSLNAGAALLIAGKVENLEEGIKKANRAIENGDAKKTLEKIVEVTAKG